MENEVVVETVNLKKEYFLGKTRVQALRGIDFKLYKGDMVIIMGPSGCGKSTFLNMIGALDNPTEGTVYIDGVDVTKLNDKQVTELRRYKLGFIFQFYNLIPVLTAIENVELPMLVAKKPKNERQERAKELLETVGLGDRLHHRPDELSGGEQQRVSIARALANDPSLILADEPTGDIDTKTGAEIVDLMGRINKKQGTTFLIVTHDQSVGKIGNRIVRFKDGVIENEETIG
ncbi:MAG: ABC transporter ATP-binding protein [Promethearchaeota archaeon]